MFSYFRKRWECYQGWFLLSASGRFPCSLRGKVSWLSGVCFHWYEESMHCVHTCTHPNTQPHMAASRSQNNVSLASATVPIDRSCSPRIFCDGFPFSIVFMLYIYWACVPSFLLKFPCPTSSQLQPLCRAATLVWLQAQKQMCLGRRRQHWQGWVWLYMSKIHARLGVKFSSLELATTGEAQQRTYRGGRQGQRARASQRVWDTDT